jgi:hypothetical protein
MMWFTLDAKGREAGPMDEEAARETVEAGDCLAVRSGTARKWTPVAESEFAVIDERPPTLNDLPPAEAGKLLSDAIALGILKATLALMGVGFLLGILWQFLH